MESKMGGYVGKILRVDLSSQELRVEKNDRNDLEQYIGGAGLGAALLYRETNSNTDPLGPENRLIFMTGPFTGTIIPCSSKHAVVSKSPLTGIYGEADSGGYWGTVLKGAGFDGVVIQGASSQPVYLYINNNQIKLRSAKHLWGMDTYQLDAVLKEETSDKAVICSIGPAGEKMVKIASIMNDGVDARAAGRCGLGAVMGSKKLKAIVVAGQNKIEVAYPEKLRQSIKESTKRIVKLTQGMRSYGTGGGMATIEKIGDLPIKNWTQGSWDQAENISGIAMSESMLVKSHACRNCVIKCGRVIRVNSEDYTIPDSAGPEYETLASFGSLCLIDNLEAIAKANELCNRFGLDTISTGGVIAFAMEAVEKGFLTGKEIEDLDLRWGNESAVLTLIEKIANRSGIGEILGQGVKAAAEYLGPGAEKFAIHVKGLELPLHDPRAHNSLAVAYATSNRGACHLQGFVNPFERSLTLPELGYEEVQDRFAVKGKGIFTAEMQNLSAVFDSLKLCKFLFFGGVRISEIIEWFNFTTGRTLNIDELMEIGERIYNLKRLYNTRLGITSKDDTLPERILSETRGEGGAADNLPPLKMMLEEYYHFRGWDRNGIPLSKTIEKLMINEKI